MIDVGLVHSIAASGGTAPCKWQADITLKDEGTQIKYSEALKIEPDFEVGEDVSEEVKLSDLGRRSILSLRQNLIARIHEHDNTIIY